MRNKIHVSPVIKIATVILVLLNVDVSFQQWYQRPLPANDNYESPDDQFSVLDSNDNPRDRSNWFNQKYSSRTTQYLSSNTKQNENDAMQNDNIFFPGQNVQAPRNRFETISPCHGETFCEDDTDYPTDIVNRIIENHQELQSYQIDDTFEFIRGKSSGPETIQLCPSISKPNYPKKAKSLTGEWMYIINTSNFTQGMWTETCVEQGKACGLDSTSIPYGYVTSCKQTYVTRILMALDKSNQPVPQSFKFPTNCCCHVEVALDGTIAG
ncbi:neurotrophin 1-like [Osmia bicornis bicornis]|uniref:neurotrophin 1-like n=1 Tax=Osmia bicornis bicornis TaxID=1437191 RepID=UPI001EAF37B4|nr:neurotrophin 1-like [Osmia bicornis bicornis]